MLSFQEETNISEIVKILLESAVKSIAIKPIGIGSESFTTHKSVTTCAPIYNYKFLLC